MTRSLTSIWRMEGINSLMRKERRLRFEKSSFYCIFCHHVYFEIYVISNFLQGHNYVLLGMSNHHDSKCLGIVVNIAYCQGCSIESNEAFWDDVSHQLTVGHVEFEPERVTLWCDRCDRDSTVNVALHDVPSKSLLRIHGSFEVDFAADLKLSKVRSS